MHQDEEGENDEMTVLFHQCGHVMVMLMKCLILFAILQEAAGMMQLTLLSLVCFSY